MSRIVNDAYHESSCILVILMQAPGFLFIFFLCQRITFFFFRSSAGVLMNEKLTMNKWVAAVLPTWCDFMREAVILLGQAVSSSFILRKAEGTLVNVERRVSWVFDKLKTLTPVKWLAHTDASISISSTRVKKIANVLKRAFFFFFLSGTSVQHSWDLSL
jgi:hypothetical protein